MKMIQLSIEQLVPGGVIDSRTRTKTEAVKALAASIDNFGLLQPIVGRWNDDGKVEIIAGNRRFGAIQLLSTEGKWAADKPVDVIVVEIGDTVASAASLAENVSRRDLHPVEEYEAFARLKTEYGMTDEAIGRSYGLSELGVRQRLALGALCPEIRDAWFAGKLEDAAAYAFTLEPDHKRQLKIWRQIQKDNERYGDRAINRWTVTQALKLAANHHAALQFVGKTAYLEAGGRLVEDLFGRDTQVLDEKKLEKLVEARFETEIARLKADGWSFAVIAQQVQNRYSYGDMQAPKSTMTEEQKARLDALKASLETFPEDDDDCTPDQRMQVAAIEAEIATIERTADEGRWLPQHKATSGCFLSLDNNGVLKIEYGKIEPAKKQAAEKAKKSKDKEKAKKKVAAKGEPEPVGISNALAVELSQQQTCAISRALAGQPHTALAALVATLEARDGKHPIKASLNCYTPLDNRPSLYGAPKAPKAKPWPVRFQERLAQSMEELQTALAEIVAKAVDVRTFTAGNQPVGTEDLVRALPIDIYIEKALAAFDYERYFTGISGAGRAACLNEMGGAAFGKGVKAAEQITHCVSEAKRIGWLPKELAYPAPSKTEA